MSDTTLAVTNENIVSLVRSAGFSSSHIDAIASNEYIDANVSFSDDGSLVISSQWSQAGKELIMKTGDNYELKSPSLKIAEGIFAEVYQEAQFQINGLVRENEGLPAAGLADTIAPASDESLPDITNPSLLAPRASVLTVPKELLSASIVSQISSAVSDPNAADFLAEEGTAMYAPDGSIELTFKDTISDINRGALAGQVVDALNQNFHEEGKLGVGLEASQDSVLTIQPYMVEKLLQSQQRASMENGIDAAVMQAAAEAANPAIGEMIQADHESKVASGAGVESGSRQIT